MLRAFYIFLADFVVLGALNSLAWHPQADVAFVVQSGLCSLPLALVCASATLIFDKWSYVGLLPLFVYLCLNVSLVWVVYHCFSGLMGEGLFVSIFLATWPEVKEFLISNVRGKCLVTICVCLLLVVGQIVLLLRLHNTRIMGLRERLYVVIGALFCSMVVPAMTGDDYLIRAMSPGQSLTRFDFLDVYSDLREASSLADPNRYRVQDRSVTGIFIIGESASRLHWSLYGYERKTTPLLEARSDELIAFSNLQCTAFFTPYALRDLFLEKDENGHLTSFSSILGSLNMDAVLLSGQSRFGLYDGADELLFRQCKRRIYLDEQLDAEYYDDALVPLVRTEVCVSNSTVAFVHLMGSHFDYDLRYPKQETVFPVRNGCLADSVSDSINAYDNSIRFTDKVLDRLISDLADSKKKAFLIYVSDHGESPSSNYRDQSQVSLYALPFVVWLSPLYREAYPERVKALTAMANDKMVSSDCMPIFLRLLGIEKVRQAEERDL